MNKYYFTFLMSDEKYHDCYHIEKAKSYKEARDKMIKRYGTDWAFQYEEREWKISREQYDKFYNNGFFPKWFNGITQADLFSLKEIL